MQMGQQRRETGHIVAASLARYKGLPMPHRSAHVPAGARMAPNASVIRADALVLVPSSLSAVPAGAAGRAFGSGVAHPALPQFFGSAVTVGSVGQSRGPHKPRVVRGSVMRTTESVCSVVLAKFSRALVGRTQPMLLHSASARVSLIAQAAFWHAIACVLVRTSAKAVNNARPCIRQLSS